MKTRKTIIFTGGHHNSALLLAKMLKKEGHEIIWFGHRHSIQGDKNVSAEYLSVVRADISFIELKTGKIHLGNIWQIIKTIKAFLFCFFAFAKNRPSLIISFGGYLAVPPVMAAWTLGIPSISHEQTTVLGMANKAMLPFLRKIYLTWPIKKLAKNKKAVLVGLPIESDNLKACSKNMVNDLLKKVNIDQFFKNHNLPLLVISGGKQGSNFINHLIEKNLNLLLKNWNICHQAGSNLKTKDYQRLLKKRQKLSLELKSKYVVLDYVSNFSNILSAADIVIGRSGAHTVYEILLMGKKMLAIPLPLSFADEQKKNAQKLETAGIGVILEQKDCSSKSFLQTIDDLSELKVNQTKLESIQSNMPKNALQLMYGDIKKMLD
jgi:UDP-N-acetylglucosamine--N-acetylmuramyl-(pentapeptide) pyrophosphoryl-undecaprenol N-acetylglucosamine transferase